MSKKLFNNMWFIAGVLGTFGLSLQLAIRQADSTPRGREVLLYAALDTLVVLLVLRTALWGLSRAQRRKP